MNQRVKKAKANAVVASSAKASRPNENGRGDCAASGGGEKEKLIPPMLLAGLISAASKSTSVDLVGLMTINPREQTWQ